MRCFNSSAVKIATIRNRDLREPAVADIIKRSLMHTGAVVVSDLFGPQNHRQLVLSAFHRGLSQAVRPGTPGYKDTPGRDVHGKATFLLQSYYVHPFRQYSSEKHPTAAADEIRVSGQPGAARLVDRPRDLCKHLELEECFWPNELVHPSLQGFQESVMHMSWRTFDAGLAIAMALQPEIGDIMERSSSHLVRLLNYRPLNLGSQGAGPSAELRKWHTDLSILTAVSAPR